MYPLVILGKPILTMPDCPGQELEGHLILATYFLSIQIGHLPCFANVMSAPDLVSLLPRLLRVIEGADTLVIYNAVFETPLPCV